jgi:pimeloyl-ACP methyl ester carboxylesterase
MITQIYPASLALEMYETIPRSYLWIIPNGGHGPLFNMIERFNETAMAFLRGEWNQE